MNSTHEWMRLNEWICEWVSDWVSKWMNGWRNEGMSDWVIEWMSSWMRKSLIEWVFACLQRRFITIAIITVIMTIIIIIFIIIIIIINQGCNRLLERSVMWFMRAICYWGHSVMSTSSAFCCVCCAMHAKICATCKRSDMYAMYTSGLLLDMLVLPLHRLMGGVC